jgi:quercetin dioxygenase-like cupin family protein
MPFVDLRGGERREIVPGYRAHFVHSERMTMAQWSIEAGAELPEHSHPHEQITWVLEGRFEMIVGGERRVLEPGMAAVFPSGVPHSARAETACRVVDAFHPVREEYR